MNVFVHLAHGAGRTSWKERWTGNKVLGINHDNLYGYQQATEWGCRVEQSEDVPEHTPRRLFRLLLRRLIGFDILHAWHNRRGILAAEVVWTHTEMESMAILLLFKLRSGRRPKLIAQNIWLIDEWEKFSFPRKSLYRALLRDADVLTFHSVLNEKKARQIFPEKATAVVPFGIRNDLDLYQPAREMHEPRQVLTVGNDRHRDWKTFVAALKNDPRYIAKMVVSRNAPDLSAVNNIARERPRNNDELFPLFRWADIVVVPLKHNLHVSGITAIQEAVLFGIPVVCSDVGGLREYFSEDEISYVPSGDPVALRAAVEALSNDPTLAKEKATRALARMRSGALNSKAFVAEHVAISRKLLSGYNVTP